jgi:sulfur-carrier protein
MPARVMIRLSGTMTLSQPQTTLSCAGTTVGEALADCCRLLPELRPKIFREDGKTWVGVFLNGRSVSQLHGLDTPIADGDEVRLTPPIAGG